MSRDGDDGDDDSMSRGGDDGDGDSMSRSGDAVAYSTFSTSIR